LVLGPFGHRPGHVRAAGSGAARLRILAWLTVAAWSLATLVAAPRAAGAEACSYDPAEELVRIALSAEASSRIIVSVGSGSEIWVNGSSCVSSEGETATLSGTGTIQVTGTSSDDHLGVDLSGGPFGGVGWIVDLGEGTDTLGVRGRDGPGDAITVGSVGFSFEGSSGSHAGIERFVLRGLAGNDVLSAAGGTPETGGAVLGRSLIVGGPGTDRLEGGFGGDEFRGGPGRDLVTYLSHETEITASLDGLANDGMAGEDFIRGDVENLMGGMGSDHLVGNASANRLAGAPGSDVLEGGDGRDRLRGEQENDLLFGGRGDDLLRGGRGEDLLEGESGRDTLEGDAHPDTLRGGGGDDTLLARDGWVDSVVGGRGIDTAYADAADDVSGCEEVDRGRRPYRGTDRRSTGVREAGGGASYAAAV
jgi:Ca2+-binding RTX toxin-like protein